MAKRYLRMSPEFIEDLTEFSKSPDWCEKVLAGKFKIQVDVENDSDDYRHFIPIKIHRQPFDGLIIVEWEVSIVEDAFERTIFRQLREE